MSESTITLYRVETMGHSGPFNGGLSYEERDANIIIEAHTAPVDMELSDAATAAVGSANFFYFFSDFETLKEVFTLKKGSLFHVKQVEVPTSLDLDKYFELQGYQVIFDSDTYLEYHEQGKVITRHDLTQLITQD